MLTCAVVTQKLEDVTDLICMPALVRRSLEELDVEAAQQASLTQHIYTALSFFGNCLVCVSRAS